ncbi:hypothetical protein WA026_016761 [Henosepilachna vigintioctopunctata]|uniref:Uncharacterized protein n=1 Tax=Henosepilachna vigintioctopunctata TaxID=420089 RepID=A0AAW1UUF9_9CUCU
MQFNHFSGSDSNSVVPTNIRKFMIYSIHDDQIFSVLNALKVPNLKPAPYGSSVIFELRKSVNGKLYVQIFYKTDSFRLQVINIQKCDVECSLKDFNEILDPIQISREDYKNKCFESS